MPVRVLHVIDSLGVGGAQEILLAWGRRSDPRRIVHAVCALHGPLDRWGPLPDGMSAWSLARRRADPRIPFRLVRLLRRERFDVVQAHLFFSVTAVGVIGALGGISAGTARVLTVHALRDQLPPWDFPVYRMVSRVFDVVLTDVEVSRNELIRAGIERNRIRVVPMGFDADRAAPVRGGEAIRREFRIPREAPLVLRVARFHPDKGFADVIAAAETVWETVPEARFLLVGEGPERPVLERRAAAASRPDRILFSGFRSDLGDLLDACDVAAAPSLAESVGMATLAALAAGRPVVAYDVGAVREAVRDGITGRLVRRGDRRGLGRAIAGLLRDGERRRMGEAGRRLMASDYSIESALGRLEGMYRELIRRHHSGYAPQVSILDPLFGLGPRAGEWIWGSGAGPSREALESVA